MMILSIALVTIGLVIWIVSLLIYGYSSNLEGYSWTWILLLLGLVLVLTGIVVGSIMK